MARMLLIVEWFIANGLLIETLLVVLNDIHIVEGNIVNQLVKIREGWGISMTSYLTPNIE
jgi:hypothetical protein